MNWERGSRVDEILLSGNLIQPNLRKRLEAILGLAAADVGDWRHKEETPRRSGEDC